MSSTPLTSTNVAEVSESEVVRTSRPDPVVESSPRTLYRAVWRWHFLAGLIVAPVMIVASATGAIYTFHNELTPWLYPQVFVAQPSGERLSVDRQLEHLKEQVPDFDELDALNLKNDPRRSTDFIAHAFPGGHANPDQKHRVYSIDPYSGKLLGTRLMEEDFFHYVLELHRSLFAGMTGRVIVELTTSWGLILMVTGVYLWWPRGKARSIGVWRPRLSGKLYVVLRDLHAVFGFYAAGFAALILATGFFFSAVSGSGFTLLSAKLNQSLGAFLAPIPSPSQPEGAKPALLEAVAATALAGSRPGDGVYVMISEKPEMAHKAYVMTDGDTNTVRGLDIDQFTGQLIKMTDTPDLTPMVRLLALAESLHQGKTFGLPSKIIAFLTCLVLVALSITGVWMWWQRRPAGESGFPKRPAGPIPTWVWAIVIALGIVLPVAGASMILFMIGESFIRWRRLAT